MLNCPDPFMLYKVHSETYHIAGKAIRLAVPDRDEVFSYYEGNQDASYWAQVWPAAAGLAEFIQTHPESVKDKAVLELAAGLGLPGLLAAEYAASVFITEKEALAIPFIDGSVNQLALNNVKVAALDWQQVGEIDLPDVVLLSDVNYEPAIFAELKQVIEWLLAQNAAVIISTPQRLMAKEFINSVLTYAKEQWETTVTLRNKDTAVSVFVLQQ